MKTITPDIEREREKKTPRHQPINDRELCSIFASGRSTLHRWLYRRKDALRNVIEHKRGPSVAMGAGVWNLRKSQCERQLADIEKTLAGLTLAGDIHFMVAVENVTRLTVNLPRTDSVSAKQQAIRLLIDEQTAILGGKEELGCLTTLVGWLRRAIASLVNQPEQLLPRKWDVYGPVGWSSRMCDRYWTGYAESMRLSLRNEEREFEDRVHPLGVEASKIYRIMLDDFARSASGSFLASIALAADPRLLLASHQRLERQKVLDAGDTLDAEACTALIPSYDPEVIESSPRHSLLLRAVRTGLAPLVPLLEPRYACSTMAREAIELAKRAADYRVKSMQWAARRRAKAKVKKRRMPSQKEAIRIPMRPDELPLQRLHLVERLPELPNGLEPRADWDSEEFEPPHCPAVLPTAATFMGMVEWSWSPFHSRVDSLYISLNSRRTHWLLWNRPPMDVAVVEDDYDRSSLAPRRYSRVCAYGPRRGTQKKIAAIYLLLNYWRYDAAEHGVDHPHWINRQGLLCVSELLAIAREVWPRVK